MEENKLSLKYRLLLILLCSLFIMFLTATFVGELALLICGAVHLTNDAFNISDGGAIAMIVVGWIMFISEFVVLVFIDI